MMTSKDILEKLHAQANPAIAEHSARFFKTGKGEYGEGDRFLGIRVPLIRKLARQCRDTPWPQVRKLLYSEYHEVRLFACILMVYQFEKADEAQQQALYEAYLQNTHQINNWDLVDSSAHQIVGGYLLDRSHDVLHQLSQSNSLWERRIAIIATLHFIKHNRYETTLTIAQTLLHDKEDLIHKAVGWMLREVGNRDRSVEVTFLNRHYRQMPRTMLRYAIEKFDAPARQSYLRGEI